MNGDLLLTPVRRLLAAWIPYPPRIEISSLGEAPSSWARWPWGCALRSTTSS